MKSSSLLPFSSKMIVDIIWCGIAFHGYLSLQTTPSGRVDDVAKSVVPIISHQNEPVPRLAYSHVIFGPDGIIQIKTYWRSFYERANAAYF